MAIVAAAGMGGIGKTALAQQYLRQFKDAYPGGRWYLRVRETSLALQVQEVATFQGWQIPDQIQDEKQRVQWVYGHWQSQFPGQRLLLLDDVSDYGQIRDFLPSDPSFQVLMTTRNKFRKPVNRLDLDVLPSGDALDLLRTLVEDAARIDTALSDAEALCQWVGYLPLGLELMGRYLAAHPNLSLAKLQQRLEEKRLEAKALNDVPSEMAYQINLQAAFELSWQDLTPPTKTLAGLLSIFALAPIPAELITLALLDWDEETLEEALDSALVYRSLVQTSGDGTYQLHQLVREFLQQKLKTELAEETLSLQKSVATALTTVAKQIPQTITLHKQGPIKASIPHMKVVALSLNAVMSDEDAPDWVFIGLARFYQNQSLWPEAFYWWQACVKMTENRFGADHPDTATSLNNLAGLYRSMGRYGEAEPLYVRSLAIREAQLGADHPATATSLNNLAELSRSMGRYGEAEPLYVRSLEISEAQLRPDHPDTAISWHNFAFFCASMSRYKQAEEYYLRAISTWSKTLGKDHPNTQTGIRNFTAMVQQVIDAGQVEQLSEHPLTRVVLEIVRGEG